MSGKISEYTNEALAIGDDDWFDISVDTGSGFESQKLKGSTIKALITAGVNLGTGDLTQTDPTRTFDCDNNDLSFINGNIISISATQINMTDTKVTGSLISDDDFIAEKAIYERGIQLINTTGTLVSTNASNVGVDSSLGTIEVLLPSAALNLGRKITIGDSANNASTYNITITPDGSELINNQPNLIISENFGWVTLVSNGYQWGAYSSDLKSNANGQMYMHNNATATTVASTLTFYEVAGTTTASADNSKYTHTNNRLTNSNPIGRKYLVQATLSFEAGNGDVCEFGFYDSKLGAIRTPSRTKSTADASGKSENISMTCVVNHISGDYIEVHAANNSSATDITVTDMNVVITEL